MEDLSPEFHNKVKEIINQVIDRRQEEFENKFTSEVVKQIQEMAIEELRNTTLPAEIMQRILEMVIQEVRNAKLPTEVVQRIHEMGIEEVRNAKVSATDSMIEEEEKSSVIVDSPHSQPNLMAVPVEPAVWVVSDDFIEKPLRTYAERLQKNVEIISHKDLDLTKYSNRTIMVFLYITNPRMELIESKLLCLGAAKAYIIYLQDHRMQVGFNPKKVKNAIEEHKIEVFADTKQIVLEFDKNFIASHQIDKKDLESLKDYLNKLNKIVSKV